MKKKNTATAQVRVMKLPSGDGRVGIDKKGNVIDIDGDFNKINTVLLMASELDQIAGALEKSATDPAELKKKNAEFAKLDKQKDALEARVCVIEELLNTLDNDINDLENDGPDPGVSRTNSGYNVARDYHDVTKIKVGCQTVPIKSLLAAQKVSKSMRSRGR